jgi:hypothetical protein
MTRRDLLALGPFCVLTACSSTPEPTAEKKPPEPVTGLHALYGMYQQARIWTPDPRVVSCQSIDISQVKARPGKAAAWQAVFAAPSLGRKRAYTYSVYDAGTSLRQGIFPDSPSAMGSDTRSFLIAGARTDTDQAWETALKRGEAYAKKNPDMPISFTLELSRSTNAPAWRVIWGASAASSDFSIVVDAGSGDYVQTLR